MVERKIEDQMDNNNDNGITPLQRARDVSTRAARGASSVKEVANRALRTGAQSKDDFNTGLNTFFGEQALRGAEFDSDTALSKVANIIGNPKVSILPNSKRKKQNKIKIW